MGLLTKVFGTRSERVIKSLRKPLAEINSKKEWAKALTDEEILELGKKWKQYFAEGGDENKVICDILAVAREVAGRRLGEFPYDVQILGALVLNRGEILEMKTGEGKTLTSSMAATLGGLKGKGVHVVTVNDYLAKRDEEWMRPIYSAFGLTSGCVLAHMSSQERLVAYRSDITYGTNNEFGFDYLRDNMKYTVAEKLQRDHNFCIIDEIDSILIDEARTPLIISAPQNDDSAVCRMAASIAPLFQECEKNPETGTYYEVDPLERFNATTWDDKGDYKLDEKSKNITFTRDGMAKMERILKEKGIIHGELNSDENILLIHYVTQAVCALRMYKRDVDYIVSEKGVQIVDEFTGRVLEGRRYSDGLHQAIEAKEGVKIMARNTTLATITLQNFFRMYKKIAGMTGTAITEEGEFGSIYNLQVTVLPTHLPIKRQDANDFVFFNEKYKLDAICAEVKRVHETGQPILVGTISIEKSEEISSRLTRMGIPHNVLNAKNHQREAQIVMEAGAKGAVTIATNMAGRGTDIKLGGSIDRLVYKKIPTDSPAELVAKTREEVKDEWQKASDEVKALGGLYILGTERHESRRIDNQLRGRSGRQGDPGFTRFYVSLDDDLMRLFARDNVRALLKRGGMDAPEPIESSMVTKALERAQKKVEERNFIIRKHLLEYDDVLNSQRSFIYEKRDEIIQDKQLCQRMIKNAEDLIEDALDALDMESALNLFSPEDASEIAAKIKAKGQISSDEKKAILFEAAENNINNKAITIGKSIAESKKLVFKDNDAFNSAVKEIGERELGGFIRLHFLDRIDRVWRQHLEELEALRESVGLRQIAQKNPLTEYKVEGADIFDKMIEGIKHDMVMMALRVRVVASDEPKKAPPEQKTEARHDAYQSNAGQTHSTIVRRTTQKVGRNDPCPCGSGKKYKNCCGKGE